MNKTYQLETISCPSCIKKIEGMLKTLNGVESSEVLFNSSRVKVNFNESTISSALIKAKIHQLGYNVISEK
jgi:copper chaperone CopZ